MYCHQKGKQSINDSSRQIRNCPNTQSDKALEVIISTRKTHAHDMRRKACAGKGPLMGPSSIRDPSSVWLRPPTASYRARAFLLCNFLSRVPSIDPRILSPAYIAAQQQEHGYPN